MKKSFNSETCTYILPNLIRVEITGVDLDDCFETFNKRRQEFNETKNNIRLYTPRLSEYLHKVVNC